MADYVSKYTGSEVDGILDEAIELPQGTSSDDGKFLKYSSNSGLIWDSTFKTLPIYNNETKQNDNYDVYPLSSSGADAYLKWSSNSGEFCWDNNVLPVPPNDDKYILVSNYGSLTWELWEQ